MLSIENFKIISNFGPLQRMSRMTEHVGKAGKVDSGDRVTLGAIHSTKISGNFGPKPNGSVRSNRKSFEKTGPPFEVDYFSRSDRSEFWLNGSCPLLVKL